MGLQVALGDSANDEIMKFKTQAWNHVFMGSQRGPERPICGKMLVNLLLEGPSHTFEHGEVHCSLAHATG